jgi:hypothetical protein
MTSPNKKYKNGSPIRYYIRQEIQERFRQKTLLRNTNRGEQLRQRMVRSARAKEAHMKAREERKSKLFAALDIIHDDDFIFIPGTPGDIYIRGGWRNWHIRKRWVFEDVVQCYQRLRESNVIVID